ncbi:MAG: aldehyde dehydrogenase family protein, partial [Dokdonella sp.]|uniref:aldehyde dehydrogenase family protein n=1 Tax=Dokdonella sp. TaxID=2291710 RepID=UPI003264D5EC
LSALRDDAVAAGASTHSLTDTQSDPLARIFEPTLLSNVDDAMEVMQAEIFGPLLPLLPYDSLDQALAYVNAHPHPLALYAFDDDSATIEHILRGTQAGGVSVNDTLLHIAQHDLPFGGVGSSGMGAYHGEAGFQTFSRMTPVFRQSRFSLTGLLNPPYGALFRRMVALLLGR